MMVSRASVPSLGMARARRRGLAAGLLSHGLLLVGLTTLPAGSVLQAAHRQEAEIDWAAERSLAMVDPAELLGRTLARSLVAGAAVRQADLKQQLWFAAGDTVQVAARGNGFSVSGTGLALAAGLERQTVQLCTDNGWVLSGLPVGANRVEVQS